MWLNPLERAVRSTSATTEVVWTFSMLEQVRDASYQGSHSSVFPQQFRLPQCHYIGRVEPRVSLITLGVSDLARARAFYEKLGWHGQEVEETVFFQAGGMALVLWDSRKLAADAGVSERVGDAFGGITLAHNVRTETEVDEILGTAEAAGGTVTKPAARTFYGGYAGYFADPDGHVWEIAHNPGFELTPDGSLVLPDFGGR